MLLCLMPLVADEVKRCQTRNPFLVIVSPYELICGSVKMSGVDG